MFTTNLRSLIQYDSFKLTKSVYCRVFRTGLLVKTQPKNISHRYFTAKFGRNTDEKPIVLSLRANNLRRQITIKPPTKFKGSPIRWKAVIIVAVVGSAFVALLSYLKNEKLKKREAHRNRVLGKIKLGGKFELIDQDNKPVSSDDFLGQWLLIYFGFTHCPDICPDEIEKMVEVIDTIDQRKDMMKVKPLFITVDPERDTPSIIKKYLKEYSDKIIGLTGTIEQIAATCKAYRVYFSPGPKDSDADYIVDHSIIMYLIDPEGKFMDYYGQNKDAKDIVNSIHFNQMKKYATKTGFQKITQLFSNA